MKQLKKNLKKHLHNISLYDYVIAIMSGFCFVIATWKISSVAHTLNNIERRSFFIQILLLILVVELVGFLIMQQQLFHRVSPIIHRAIGSFLGVCLLIQVYILCYPIVFS